MPKTKVPNYMVPPERKQFVRMVKDMNRVRFALENNLAGKMRAAEGAQAALTEWAESMDVLLRLAPQTIVKESEGQPEA